MALAALVSLSKLIWWCTILILILMLSPVGEAAAVVGGSTSWCVARSDASTEALQSALDYACASGADCSALQTNSLCFLPNTIQAHASYAFNSFYQRKSMAPGSCDFSGTATVAKSDPSYGSCVYPASLGAAGGTSATPNTQTTPSTSVPFPPTMPTPLSGNGNGNGFNSPPFPDADSCIDFTASRILVIASLLLAVTFIF